MPGRRVPDGPSLVDSRERYVVDNSHLESFAAGLAYRRSKDLEDRDDWSAEWGSVIFGKNLGDGWVLTKHPKKLIDVFLPLSLKGVTVLAKLPAVETPEAFEGCYAVPLDDRKSRMVKARPQLGPESEECLNSGASHALECGHVGCMVAAKSVDRSYHANIFLGGTEKTSCLPSILASRGLRQANVGELALLSMWWHRKDLIAAEVAKEELERATGKQRWKPPDADKYKRVAEPGFRGIIELCGHGAVPLLDNKRFLAHCLDAWGCSEFHPQTAYTPEDLFDGADCDSGDEDKDLWFLKHEAMNLQRGVSVHVSRRACLAAWQQKHLVLREKFIAQREVKNPLLDENGCKIVLRVYVLLLVATGDRCHGSSSWALARREFLCKSHPMPYDSNNLDPRRHIDSSIIGDGQVQWRLGSAWDLQGRVWPRVVYMLARCFGPLMPRIATEIPGGGGARALTFEVLGVDVIVDRDFKPWLLEINLFPDLKPVKSDPALSELRVGVIDDILRVTIDRPLKGQCLRGSACDSNRWKLVASWNEGAPVPGDAADEAPLSIPGWVVALLPWLGHGWSDGTEGQASMNAALSAAMS